MNEKKYTTPEITFVDYAPSSVIAMSWSDEEADEVLSNERNCDDEWESFWQERE